MDLIPALITAFSALVFVGFPTLLVVMAWITREPSAKALSQPAQQRLSGHASQARARRRAASALGGSTIIVAPVRP